MASTLPRSLGVLLLLVLAAGVTGCYDTPDAGTIGVVRNGGPFDNKKIRQIVCPGSGNTWVGWASNTHFYPDSTQQRLYKLDDTKDADSAPVQVQTKDGVRTTIKGTFYFKTRFNCSAEGTQVVKDFDEAFVNRPAGQKPWEDWSGWLNSTIQPVIDSNMRNIVAEFECRQLVTSCNLVQNSTGSTAPPPTEKVDNKSNIQQIQTRVQDGLVADLEAKLGANYFQDIVFNLQSVELPGVQSAIDEAQREFAKVSKAQAAVQTATQKKRANKIKQKGYNACPSCARQDELRSLPRGLQALGGNIGLTIGGR